MLSLLNTLYDAADIPLKGWWILLLGTAQYIPPYTLVPRFILNLRALYARDHQGRRGSDIESAFGLPAGSIRGATGSAIVFADIEENEELGQEEIQMVERTGEDRAAGSRA